MLRPVTHGVNRLRTWRTVCSCRGSPNDDRRKSKSLLTNGAVRSSSGTELAHGKQIEHWGASVSDTIPTNVLKVPQFVTVYLTCVQNGLFRQTGTGVDALHNWKALENYERRKEKDEHEGTNYSNTGAAS
jgi:hypothetical protein